MKQLTSCALERLNRQKKKPCQSSPVLTVVVSVVEGKKLDLLADSVQPDVGQVPASGLVVR